MNAKGMVLLSALAVAVSVTAQQPGAGNMKKDRFGGGSSGPGMHGGQGGQVEPGKPEAGGKMDEGMMARIVTSPAFAEKLGLSEDQVKKLRDGILELRKKEIQLKADQEIAGEEQAQLMTDENADESAILAAIEKAGKIRIEMAKAKARQLLLIKKILTPEQRKTLRGMIREHMEKNAGDGMLRERFRNKRAQGEDGNGQRFNRGEGKKDRWGGNVPPAHGQQPPAGAPEGLPPPGGVPPGETPPPAGE